MKKRLFTLMSVVSMLLPAQQGQGSLKVIVLEGEGAFNNVKQKTGRDALVEVRDLQDRPISGALVQFTLPFEGPSGTFANHSRVYRTSTDANGRAKTEGLTPNSTEGRFSIKVDVSQNGREGHAIISQSNTLAGGLNVPGKTGGSSKKILWLGLIGGAAAGGILAASHGGGHSTPAAAAPTPTSLTIGAISVGGPR